MSEHADEHHPRTQPATTQGRRPGHELGAARERAGIPLEEMAARLHLARDQVEALERDDYQHLPAATFVRGYLRAYSKEVGLDGDAMVAEFDALCDEPAAPELIVSHGTPDPATGRGPAIAILVLLLMAVVGAGGWWLQEQTAVELPEDVGSLVESEGTVAGDDAAGPSSGTDDAGDETTTTAESASTDAATTDAATTDDATTDDATTDDAATANGEAALPGEDDGANALEGGSDTVDAGAESADTGAPDGVEADYVRKEVATATVESPTTGGDDTAGALTADPEGPLATSDATLAASDAAATGPDRLEIRVYGESWLEVYDSRGEQLAYTLYSGSSPVVLNGWAPFDVFLGNSPAVTVRVDDVTLDQSAFVRSDNTARFIADREGARRR